MREILFLMDRSIYTSAAERAQLFTNTNVCTRTRTYEGTCRVMDFVVGNKHSDPRSNHDRGCWHHSYNDYSVGKDMNLTIFHFKLVNIRYVSRVKWRNQGKGVAPSPTPRCSSY